MEAYADYHTKRFEFLENKIIELSTEFGREKTEILEVGRGPFTNRLRKRFSKITTMGFPIQRSVIANIESTPDSVPHLVFDLNETQSPEKWITVPAFQIIIFAEVIEHLTTAPEHVLAFLRTCLTSTGVIICQTPNAASFHNRIKLLVGRNPYDRILLDNRDPAHFREYTKAELIEIAHKVGLEVVHHSYENYFGFEKKITKWIDIFTGWIPQFRRGQTIVFRRTK
jgi:hypothetical protein